MIYYDIQHHGDTERLQWLSRLLDDGKNIINFSLDLPKEAVEDHDAWCKNNFNYAQAVKSFPITWCGPSQVTQIRNMLEKAVEYDGWEYLINLSGLCFPTRSQAAIKAIIKNYRKVGIRSFCQGFQPKRPDYWISHDRGKCKDSYVKYKYLRLTLELSEDVLHAFQFDNYHPVTNVMQRRSVHCIEVPHERRLILRGLEDWEIRERTVFWGRFGYYVGRTWVILHREQVEWILTSRYMFDLYHHAMSSFEPDESFLPSLLLSIENPFMNSVERNNLRWQQGGPAVINKSNVHEVLSSDAIFARKLSSDGNVAVLKAIENKVWNSRAG